MLDLWPDAPHTPIQVEQVAGSIPDRGLLARDPAATLDDWLIRRVIPRSAETARRDDLVRRAVALVDADPTGVEIADLARAFEVSVSTLYRAFVSRVRMSPKRYVSVMRFQRFTRALLDDHRGDGAAVLAALAGYYDQSHATRDFVRHTGMSPRGFMGIYDGIARLMS